MTKQRSNQVSESDLASLLAALLTDVSEGERSAGWIAIALKLHLGETTYSLIEQLDSKLERLKLRTRALESLYRTANDLSALTNVGEVLEAIVSRARSILESDTAYLFLVDSATERMHMRVTEGTVDVSFSEISMPVGAGLAGRVAAFKRPMWTSDYAKDTRFENIVSQEVTGEGLISILGAPLMVGNQVLGVLLVADRERRRYSIDEVSLIVSLSNHAAITLHTASLFESVRSSVAELEESIDREEIKNQTLQRITRFQSRLSHLVLEKSGVSAICEALVETIGGNIVLIDANGDLAARAGKVPGSLIFDSYEVGDRVDSEILSNIQEVSGEAEFKAVKRGLHIGGTTGSFFEVNSGNETLGWLIHLSANSEASEASDGQAIENAVLAIALLWMTERAADEAAIRLGGGVVESALSGGFESVEALYRQANLLSSANLKSDLAVVTLMPASSFPAKRLEQTAYSLVRRFDGFGLTLGKRIILVLPGATRSNLDAIIKLGPVARTLLAEQVSLGAEFGVKGLTHLRDAEDRARQAATALQSLGRFGEIISLGELGVFGLFSNHASTIDLREFVKTKLSLVAQYDQQHNADLLLTVEAYFAHRESVAEAAKSLYIHPNTLYQRIARLDIILSPEWRKGTQSLELQFALRLRFLLQMSDDEIGEANTPVPDQQHELKVHSTRD